MPLFPRFSSPTTHIVTDIPDWDDTMDELASLALRDRTASPYDSAKSNFSYQLRYHDSVTNPGPSQCDFWCVSDKTCQHLMRCHTIAITFLVDAPLPLLLIVKEPPPTLPPASHHRYLSHHQEWSGPSPRYDYSITVPLQPGINHITWCKRAGSGIEMSFFPPAYGDWPTISPHPYTSLHELKFFSYYTKYYPCNSPYKQVSYHAFSSFSFSLHKQPHSFAVYSRKGTVPSLFLQATIAVMGMGYLRPTRKDHQLLPPRLTDETYHFVKLTDSEGIVLH